MKLSRNLRKKFRKVVKPNVISIEGVRVSTDLADVTKDIRGSLFKETYEEPERRLLAEAIRKGDRVLEIGGGIGFVSTVCAKIVGAENLLSYEPNPAMVPVIEKNFSLNGIVPQLRNRAVNVKKGTVQFHFADNIFSSSLYDRNLGHEADVECDAISDVLAEFRPNAIVMDIEGAEVDLLPACDLSKIEKIIVEMHPHIVGDSKVQELVDYLTKQGFSLQKKLSISYLFVR